MYVVGAAVLLCALACAPAARAQLDQWGYWENGVTEHWWLSSKDFAAEDALGAVARWKSVGEDNGRGDGGAWAGDYSRGSETHGTYLRWSPRAGFVIAHVNKCEARVMGLVYGRVEATPALVQFFPELDKASAGAHGGGHHGGARKDVAPRAVIRFVPVMWRGERLLVSEEEMADFGDYVAGLGRYNEYAGLLFLGYDFFFRRSGEGSESDDDAPPAVPPGYERFIKRPIEARITSVGRRVLRRDYTIEGENTSATYARAALTYVTIDAGAAQGVKDRMVFRVLSPDEGDTVVVVRAGRRTSTAAVVRDADERGAENYFDHESREKQHSKVAAGWRLTTSLF